MPADLSILEVRSVLLQADKLVALSKLQETQAQMEHLKGSNHVLRVRHEIQLLGLQDLDPDINRTGHPEGFIQSIARLTPPPTPVQVQVASAESDRKQLLEAFTHERAKRESEALTARRALEARLDEMVSEELLLEFAEREDGGTL